MAGVGVQPKVATPPTVLGGVVPSNEKPGSSDPVALAKVTPTPDRGTLSAGVNPSVSWTAVAHSDMSGVLVVGDWVKRKRRGTSSVRLTPVGWNEHGLVSETHIVTV